MYKTKDIGRLVKQKKVYGLKCLTPVLDYLRSYLTQLIKKDKPVMCSIVLPLGWKKGEVFITKVTLYSPLSTFFPQSISQL